MKIKIIDLLNKIANGEEAPKKIKYRDWLYEFEKDCNDYLCQYDSLLYRENDDVRQFLNDEVEIIEEVEQEKGIEKLDIQTNNGGSLCLRNEAGTLCGMNKHSIVMAKKINELIDEVNKLKEEKWNN